MEPSVVVERVRLQVGHFVCTGGDGSESREREERDVTSPLSDLVGVSTPGKCYFVFTWLFVLKG